MTLASAILVREPVIASIIDVSFESRKIPTVSSCFLVLLNAVHDWTCRRIAGMSE